MLCDKIECVLHTLSIVGEERVVFCGCNIFRRSVNEQKSKQRFIIIEPKRIHFVVKEANPLANLQAERKPEVLPQFYMQT